MLGRARRMALRELYTRRALGAALACLVFALLGAMQIVLQDQNLIPHELIQMLPYVATLVLLAAVAGRSADHSSAKMACASRRA